MPFSCMQLLGKKVYPRPRRLYWAISHGPAEDIKATAAAGRGPRCPLWSGNYKKRWAAGSVFHLQASRLGGHLDNRKMLRHVLRHENNRIFVLILLYCVLVSLLKLCMAQADGAAAGANDNDIGHLGDDCQVTPVIHVLQYPGCVPKPIPSFACVGRCASYIQVSGSKIWQMERSCMCCQESGEREAAVSLFCPKVKHGERKFKKVLTKAPLECMCRPCTSIEESGIIPQEIAGYSDEGPLNNHFRRIALQ
ncbi:bursicon isoform X2 [Drosophila virilis]|nr:bursicon [Drosophila virilis]